MVARLPVEETLIPRMGPEYQEESLSIRGFGETDPADDVRVGGSSTGFWPALQIVAGDPSTGRPWFRLTLLSGGRLRWPRRLSAPARAAPRPVTGGRPVAACSRRILGYLVPLQGMGDLSLLRKWERRWVQP